MATRPMQLAERNVCGRRAQSGVWTSLLVTRHFDTPRIRHTRGTEKYEQGNTVEAANTVRRFRDNYAPLTRPFLMVLDRPPSHGSDL